MAEASVEQASGALEDAQVKLGYTEIVAPVDGVVIERRVDEGQTIVASFQIPVLFVVAPEMDQRMYVYASVDEADIGQIRKAKDEKRPVHFTVDAYPDDTFNGIINQVRINPTTNQGVVTYTVVVEAPNEGLRLMPGMTANLSFEIEVHKSVLRVPNAALRFLPKRELVRPGDRDLLEATEDDDPNAAMTAAAKTAAATTATLRHLWLLDGDYLRAVPVTTGISDKEFTEIASPDIHAGDKPVVGIRTKAT